MSRETEHVPEAPPSPLSFSLNLYALPDVERLSPNSAREEEPSVEKAPIPPQLSIDLYPLSETQITSSDLGLEHYQETLQPEQPPVPRQITVGLYSLADVNGLPEGVLEVLPTPKALSIDLYPIANVAAPIQLAENMVEIPPSPTYISIGLHPLPGVNHLLSTSQHEGYVQEVHPVPASHAVPLYSVEDSPGSDTVTSSQIASSDIDLGHKDSQVNVGVEVVPTSILVPPQLLSGTEAEATASSFLTPIPSINVSETGSVGQDVQAAMQGSESSGSDNLQAGEEPRSKGDHGGGSKRRESKRLKSNKNV